MTLVEVPVNDTALVAVAVRRLDEAGIAVADLALRRPSLDDVFLQLTGHSSTGGSSRARMSPTGIRGSSEANGSWNTTCRSRRMRLRCDQTQRLACTQVETDPVDRVHRTA